jgi:sugar lactone lactonase YvrE
MSRKIFFFMTFMAGIIALPAAAQDETLATGLNNPRHVTYEADGTLYIAEAGSGGDAEAEGTFGTVQVGQTAQITMVAPDGTASVLIPNLLSQDLGFSDIRGAHALYPTEDSYWLVLGEGPEVPPFEGALVSSVVELDRATLETKQVIDTLAHEVAENPDGGVTASNPIDIAIADDGTLYIADASANSVLSWTETAGLQTFAAWPEATDNPVPTTIAVGTDGSIYIGFLTGYPFPAGGARIERWNPDGTLAETYTGLTLVTDMVVDESGMIYAVEMATGVGDAGYIPNSGRIVAVTEEGLSLVRGELNFPYGLALAPDGRMTVTTNSAMSAAASGEIITFEIGELQPLEGGVPAATPEAQPAETPEANG